MNCSPNLSTKLPFFALSVSCSVTHLLAPSPPFSRPPPLCTVMGIGLRAQRFGVSPWKLNKDKDIWRKICRLCHIDSWLTHVLISVTMTFFCQMLSCCFPTFLHLFYSRESVVGRGYSSQIWNGIYTHICRHELPDSAYICKIQFISYKDTNA